MENRQIETKNQYKISAKMLQRVIKNINGILEEYNHQRKCYVNNKILRNRQFGFLSLKWQDILVKFCSISFFVKKILYICTERFESF